MAGVTIQINGKTYPVACEDGQEDRIARLGADVDARVRGLASGAARAGGARAGEAHLLVMAALLLADELTDARAAAENGPENGTANGAGTAPEAAPPAAPADIEAQEKLAGSLVSLAQRIEAVAERIEAA